jgi:hypothetical protein
MSNLVELVIDQVRSSEDDKYLVLMKERYGDRYVGLPINHGQSKILLEILNNPDVIPENIIGVISGLVDQGNMHIDQIVIELKDENVILSKIYLFKKRSLFAKTIESTCSVFESLCISSHLNIPVLIIDNDLEKISTTHNLKYGKE